MVKQRNIGGDHLQSNEGNDPSAAFLDALRTQAMDELHQAALEYGIVLKDLGKFLTELEEAFNAKYTSSAVIDRQFKGDVAHQMDKLTTRALQTQVEAAVSNFLKSNCI